MLGLDDTQESSLGLVFHYADGAGLPLLDLADLRAVVGFLTSDEGRADLKGLGGLSSSTAGVILRELITFEDQGAAAFFGEPEFDTRDLLRVTADGPRAARRARGGRGRPGPEGAGAGAGTGAARGQDRLPQDGTPRTRRTTPSRAKADSGDLMQDIMRSPVARDLARTAAREIVRGVFGVGRRRR